MNDVAARGRFSGELYQTEGDFKKRVIDQTDKDKISLLLERDRQLFEDYAIQDVIITLKHSTEKLGY